MFKNNKLEYNNNKLISLVTIGRNSFLDLNLVHTNKKKEMNTQKKTYVIYTKKI
jgi:hypothetical protein